MRAAIWPLALYCPKKLEIGLKVFPAISLEHY